MKKGVYVKKTDITVKENKEPCRDVELKVRLDNNDIFERVVSVTAEIFDAQKRCITACSKKAFLEGMGRTDAELAVFLVNPNPHLYRARITVQEYEKELDTDVQTFCVLN